MTSISEADLAAVKREMRDLLIALAQMQQTISYSELAAQLRTAYIHYRAPVFDHLLQDIGNEEVAAGRPVLPVLVVNKQTGRCGAGFFKRCAVYGFDVSDPEAFWQAEFERVCTFWSDRGTG